MSLRRKIVGAVLFSVICWLGFHLLPPTSYRPVYLGAEEKRETSGIAGCRPYSVAISRYRKHPYEWLADLSVHGPRNGSKGAHIVVALRTAKEHNVTFGPEVGISKNFGLTDQTIEVGRPTVSRSVHYKKFSFAIGLAGRSLSGIVVELPEITVDSEALNLEPFAVRPVRDYLSLMMPGPLNC